jgi:hypothetical protein
VGLVSFPGSGNTWVRGLLQKVTGICTGMYFELYCLCAIVPMCDLDRYMHLSEFSLKSGVHFGLTHHIMVYLVCLEALITSVSHRNSV